MGNSPTILGVGSKHFLAPAVLNGGVMNKQPIIDGLEVHTIEVDGDDTRWQQPESARTDFPVKPGKRVVRYVLLPCPADHSNQAVLDDTAHRNLAPPDRAITETILDARQAECADRPIVGVCGAVHQSEHQLQVVGCVREDANGRELAILTLRSGWISATRFIAVVSEEPLL